MISFKTVELQQLDKILTYLKDAALWLKSMNVNYWQEWNNPPKTYTDWIIAGLNEREFFVAYDRNDEIGVFRLQQHDELFWGKRFDKSGYIHSFTVQRNKKGNNYGYKILEAISENLLREGIDFLRLDCGFNQHGLINYYKKFGFQEAGLVIVQGEKLLLLEKKLSGVEND